MTTTTPETPRKDNPMTALPENRTATTFRLRRVVELVQAAGHDAWLMHDSHFTESGADAVRLYAGPTRVDDDGVTRYGVCAGPGIPPTTAHGFVNAVADDFSVGPDHDGDWDLWSTIDLAAEPADRIEQAVADEIIRRLIETA